MTLNQRRTLIDQLFSCFWLFVLSLSFPLILVRTIKKIDLLDILICCKMFFGGHAAEDDGDWED